MRYFIYLIVTMVIGSTVILLLQGCTIRKYEVKVYASEGAYVNISPEILAEVPHTTTVQTEAEVDLPDAQVIGK